MERETIEITTPVSNQKIVLKSWLTGREKRAIQAVFLDDADFTGDKGVKIKGGLLSKSQDVAIETMVESVDGNSKGVLDVILDMREEDFNFVINEINRLTNEKEQALKKK